MLKDKVYVPLLLFTWVITMSLEQTVNPWMKQQRPP